MTGFRYGEMALDCLNNTHQLCWIFISEQIVCEMTTVGEGSARTPHQWMTANHTSLHSSLFCLLWENAELFVRKPGHASVTSASDVEGFLETGQPRPVSTQSRGWTSGCHPCLQMNRGEVTTPRAVHILGIHCLSALYLFVQKEQKKQYN